MMQLADVGVAYEATRKQNQYTVEKVYSGQYKGQRSRTHFIGLNHTLETTYNTVLSCFFILHTIYVALEKSQM